MNTSPGPALLGLGPIIPDANGSHIEGDEGSGCYFSSAGVWLWDDAGEYSIPWEDVADIEVLGPWLRGCAWWAMSAPFLLAAGRQRMNYTEVLIRRMRAGSVEAHVGRAVKRWYPLPELDAVEALFHQLSESQRFDLLGDSDFMTQTVDRARSGLSRIPPVTHRRVRKIVREQLSAR